MMKRACVMFLLVLAIGCGDKDEKGDGKGGDKKGDSSEPADAAEYEKRSVAFGEKMLAVVKPIAENAGKDCDKDAEKLAKWIDDNKPENSALVAFEKKNKDAEKEFNKKHEDLRKDVKRAMREIVKGCQDSKAMKDAFGKLKDD